MASVKNTGGIREHQNDLVNGGQRVRDDQPVFP